MVSQSAVHSRVNALAVLLVTITVSAFGSVNREDLKSRLTGGVVITKSPIVFRVVSAETGADLCSTLRTFVRFDGVGHDGFMQNDCQGGFHFQGKMVDQEVPAGTAMRIVKVEFGPESNILSIGLREIGGSSRYVALGYLFSGDWESDLSNEIILQKFDLLLNRHGGTQKQCSKPPVVTDESLASLFRDVAWYTAKTMSANATYHHPFPDGVYTFKGTFDQWEVSYPEVFRGRDGQALDVHEFLRSRFDQAATDEERETITKFKLLGGAKWARDTGVAAVNAALSIYFDPGDAISLGNVDFSSFPSIVQQHYAHWRGPAHSARDPKPVH